jgi:D-inositol-3-phosphate glycosyltransferase
MKRVAMLSVHTSPLDQPGTGDAGGMNVYVTELAKRLADHDVAVEVFTRATSSDLPDLVEVAPGVTVRHVAAGPYEGLAKEDLPGQLCTFARDLLRVEAQHDLGWYDVVHSHYWLSGQVGALAADRWGVPLVHSMHTMAKVKNTALATGDKPEPWGRVVGEEQVVESADQLIANTDDEAAQLVGRYGADPDRVTVVHPGVDLDVFRPAEAAVARRRLGLPVDATVLLFAGRIQPLKAPDVLLRAVAVLLAREPALRDRVVVPVVGGRVTDNGVGISPAELKRIFKRFYRIPASVAVRTKGSGLGLFIVRSVAKKHGGKAYAESAGQGQGSTFTLQLPAAPASA